MGEKKYIFKIGKGDLMFSEDDGTKGYRIKLIEENSPNDARKTILLDEPYFLQYNKFPDSSCAWKCQLTSLIADNNVGSLSMSFCCTDKDTYKGESCDRKKEDFSSIRILQKEDKYQLILENCRGFFDLPKSLVLPSSLLKSLNKFAVREYYEKQSNTGENQLILSEDDNNLIIKDLSGNTVCKLLQANLYVTEDSRLASNEQKDQTLQELKYVTVVTDSTDRNYEDLLIYVSDRNGNPIDNTSNINTQLSNILKSSNLYDSIIYQQISKDIFKNLTSDQLQALAEHLNDDQLQALVDHLTNHQLKTLAQELNETKLKIIVPILNENQLEALVKGLKPEQLENILPQLKMDQFKVLINSIDDPQLIDLTRNLSDHHLTILSKELWHERLPILVHTLEEDKLKDLINKLDNFKFEVVVQNLIDPSRIKVVINSLTDEKLQILARNMPEQQFAELLNNLDAKELKDIIHKLPYEKVTTVIGQSGDKHQLDLIVRVLEEKLEEQKNYIKNLLGDDNSIVDPNNPNEFSYLYYHPVVEI
ncbi:MAG: hypothetical protein PG978_000927 [Wolbachia endosymbiont of Ctenocephalides felis wCfeF]|nr:MAG: hypothetical protein PG978_000927 [Wolbachia endosymbiont of Ctenocephalides felis wCfeF]